MRILHSVAIARFIVIFGLFPGIAVTVGCADDPRQLSSQSTEVVIDKALIPGDPCDGSFGSYCDGHHLITCSCRGDSCKEGEVLSVDCRQNKTSECVTFEDYEGMARCLSDDDKTCKKAGKTYTKCSTDPVYHDEMQISTVCAMGDNGKSYEIELETTYCNDLCEHGCESQTCKGDDAACDGNTLLYCSDGHRYAVNCEAMNTTCDKSKADCAFWPD